jgi:hypothetical protein
VHRVNSKKIDVVFELSGRKVLSFHILLIHHIQQIWQILGKYYFRNDPVGEGARWRRTFGQEIYSPFLLAFTEVVKEWLLLEASAFLSELNLLLK